MTSQGLRGASNTGRLISPALHKIVKNVSWRKHSQLVSACKLALDRLQALEESTEFDPFSPLVGFNLSDSNLVLLPFQLAIESASPKVEEPALDCLFKLISACLLCGELDRAEPSDQALSNLSPRLFESVCKCRSFEEDDVELAVLKVILSAVHSPSLFIRGDLLVQMVKLSWNIHFSSQSLINQISAKAVLVQIVVIVRAQVETGSLDTKFHLISVKEYLDLPDKVHNEASLVQTVQNFVCDTIGGGFEELQSGLTNQPYLTERRNNLSKVGDGEQNGIHASKIRDDGLTLFKYLCKFSMKFGTPDNPEDQLLLKGKILALELLKVVIEIDGDVWRINEGFLGFIKQFLCLSLLKNSALPAMSIFQLLCSIFMSLLSKLRSELKSEIGIFFPMLILRVLENVLQPSYYQKMTVLNMVHSMCGDSQLMVDIFVNYDCDVDAPNIFERIVSGLFKTALGAPPGSASTLSPPQALSFNMESVKCLVAIIRSMGSWLDQQLVSNHRDLARVYKLENISDSHFIMNGEEGSSGNELHSETNSDPAEGLTLEQRRAYKKEFQKGISIFNKSPSKGIEFLINAKKIGDSPEDVALFLKNNSSLNEAMVGDYLGEREEFPLRVMHAYVDCMNFTGMDLCDAIRYFLRGFRLPGEAQKIDRIMEKFAERYCKCNPSSFASADTAYVLAYSVIMLNTDAHNDMVKSKMSKADFIRNNRGIDNGEDLPEEYLGSLYDNIINNEIMMKADSLVSQTKHPSSMHKLLGLSSILNLVVWKQDEEKAIGASSLLIRHIQEQFKAKQNKSESIFYTVTDVGILRFMVEVCWAPMLAAFSMAIDQSDDRTVISQCLQGFRHAVHVTSIMGMQTQRDAFVTSVAKFTYLHNAADMKQKNVDTVKAVISIAIEDGNYLQEAWEHVLTCLSRFEHLQLLGVGVPPESSFFNISHSESEEKLVKTPAFPSLKKKGSNNLQSPAIVAAVRGGSYDSIGVNTTSLSLITAEQINQFICNLNLLEQVGSFELNHIFYNSQRLNSEAIVAFVKALSKVAMAELQSPSDPRVFSLTKIVEVAHYNMGRIRLVWTRIWNILSEFFIKVGLLENLSIAIFVIDSLRQLAMKFLEMEELSNYNFQNEFLRPFLIIMQQSASAEIRELIVRCISQMVLSRVSNVKSGWKNVFMVFTTAAADERKNIVLLAFETIEKIVRDFFPYITETESTTFTDCVRCLITFTNSGFDSDVSLNAIAFLRFCAVKLAEGGLVSCGECRKVVSSLREEVASRELVFTDKECGYFWVPLLLGLSKLTSDPRKAIAKSALEVLFNILRDHGHLFTVTFWSIVYESIIFPVFSSANYLLGSLNSEESLTGNKSAWTVETCAVAAQSMVDLFVQFFSTTRSQLPGIVSILMNIIRSSNQQVVSSGMSALVHLTDNLGYCLLEDEWSTIFICLRDAVLSALTEFLNMLSILDDIEVSDTGDEYLDADLCSAQGIVNDEDGSLQTASCVIIKMKNHIAAQLVILQVLMELYKLHGHSRLVANIPIMLDIFSSVASHAHELNLRTGLHLKIQSLCSILDISDPPVVHFENEVYQGHLKFLQVLLVDRRLPCAEIETKVVDVCTEIMRIYLCCAKFPSGQSAAVHWILPLSSAKKEELATRTSLLLFALQALSSFDKNSFRKYLRALFPLLINLVSCEHSSRDVQRTLSNLFLSLLGPIIIAF